MDDRIKELVRSRLNSLEEAIAEHYAAQTAGPTLEQIDGCPPAGPSMNDLIRHAAGRPTDAQPEQRDAETMQPAGDWLGRQLRARRAPTRHSPEQETDRD